MAVCSPYFFPNGSANAKQCLSSCIHNYAVFVCHTLTRGSDNNYTDTSENPNRIAAPPSIAPQV